jgi:hypothetical protein
MQIDGKISNMVKIELTSPEETVMGLNYFFIYKESVLKKKEYLQAGNSQPFDLKAEKLKQKNSILRKHPKDNEGNNLEEVDTFDNFGAGMKQTASISRKDIGHRSNTPILIEEESSIISNAKELYNVVIDERRLRILDSVTDEWITIQR